MLKIKSLTCKNFMSIGAIPQSIDFSKNGLTLVLGENIDLGGNGSRNGVGKCLSENSVVKLRNSQTNEIFEITLGELYNAVRTKTDNN